MRIDPIQTIIVLAGILVITGFIVFAGQSGTETNSTSPTSNNIKPGRPQLEIEDTDFFINPEVVIEQKEVYIRNSGEGSLTISNLRTTTKGISVQLILQDRAGPLLDNRSSNWSDTLDPEEDGVISITFDNKNYSWRDFVDQKVKFQTNDPEKPEAVISFRGV